MDDEYDHDVPVAAQSAVQARLDKMGPEAQDEIRAMRAQEEETKTNPAVALGPNPIPLEDLAPGARLPADEHPIDFYIKRKGYNDILVGIMPALCLGCALCAACARALHMHGACLPKASSCSMGSRPAEQSVRSRQLAAAISRRKLQDFHCSAWQVLGTSRHHLCSIPDHYLVRSPFQALTTRVCLMQILGGSKKSGQCEYYGDVAAKVMGWDITLRKGPTKDSPPLIHIGKALRWWDKNTKVYLSVRPPALSVPLGLRCLCGGC